MKNTTIPAASLTAVLTLTAALAAWANCGPPYNASSTGTAGCKVVNHQCIDHDQSVQPGGCYALDTTLCYVGRGPQTYQTAACDPGGNPSICDYGSYTAPQTPYGYTVAGTASCGG